MFKSFSCSSSCISVKISFLLLKIFFSFSDFFKIINSISISLSLFLIIFSFVSSATITPLLTIIILLQIDSTSLSMCEENNIVLSFASSLKNSLNSIIWFGSRPFVGSSSITSLGLFIKAPAIPTLCLNPFESWEISLSSTSFNLNMLITLSISFLFF